MPALIQALWGFFAAILPSLVGRILVALGIGYATYTGFSAAVDGIYAQIQTNLQGMPVQVVNFLAYLWIDKAIATLFSAYTAAVTIKLAGGTVLKKMVVK